MGASVSDACCPSHGSLGNNQQGYQTCELIEDNDYFFKQEWYKGFDKTLFEPQKFIFFYSHYKADQEYMDKYWSSINVIDSIKHGVFQRIPGEVIAPKWKYMVRRGIPMDQIRPLFLDFFKLYYTENQQDYQIVKGVYKGHKLSTKTPLFFAGNQNLEEFLQCQVLNKDGTDALKRILIYLKETNSNLEYNPMVVHSISIFLIFLRQEQTFCLVRKMLEDSKKLLNLQDPNNPESDRELRWHFLENEDQFVRLSKSFFNTVLSQSQTFTEIHNHFQQIGFDYLKFFQELLQNIFFIYVSFPHVIKLFSVFMNEGIQLYFRMMYALVQMLQNDILKNRDASSMRSIIRNQSANFTNAQINELLRIGFGLRLVQTNDNLDRYSVHDSQKKHHNIPKPIYKLYFEVQSSIVTDDQFEAIWDWFPTVVKMTDAQMIYSNNQHGFSLDTMYQNFEKYSNDAKYMLILLKADNNAVLGVFLDQIIQGSDIEKFYGGNECFVFTVFPKMVQYNATNVNVSHIYSTRQCISIGAGGEGPALYLDAELNQSRTCRSSTYNNERLISEGNKTDFICVNLQAFVFV